MHIVPLRAAPRQDTAGIRSASRFVSSQVLKRVQQESRLRHSACYKRNQTERKQTSVDAEGPSASDLQSSQTKGASSVPLFSHDNSTPAHGSMSEVREADKPPLTPEEEEAIKRRLWYLAAKPPMYSVCIVPVLVGASAAFCETGAFLWRRTGLLLLGSIFVIAWLNLSNDAFDAAMGVDGAKAESVVNLTGNRLGVLWTANAALLAGGCLLWQVIRQLNDARIAWMLAAAISLGYMYQGPPFRLSFKGLGEPITFVTFGPLATSAFYLAHAAPGPGMGARPLVSLGAAAASVVVGFTTAAILFCSHFHQMAGDKAAGKKSPIVRLGSTKRGLQVLRWSVAITYVFAYAACLCRWLPWTCTFTLPLSIPLAGQMLQFCAERHKVPALIRPLKLHTVKWHTAVGLSLAAGFAIHPKLNSLAIAAWL